MIRRLHCNVFACRLQGRGIPRPARMVISCCLSLQADDFVSVSYAA